MTIRTRVVSGIAVNAKNCILVGRRPDNKKRPGMWEFPGGKVELAEGDASALIREWQEELNVTPRVGHRVSRVSFDLETPVVISLYHVILGDQVPQLSDDVVDIDWVTAVHAVEWLPCVPSMYLFYPQVKAFLTRLAPDAPR